MKLISLLLTFLFLAGCSVYKSPGRNFIESGGLTYSKNNPTPASAAYVSCSQAPSTSAWVPLEKTERASLATSESDEFALQVTPLNDIAYNCYFRFASAQELFENTSPAIDVCLHQSPADCQSQFAF